MERGTSFGTPTEAENELAELIVEAVPSIEKVRLVSSGTEATMSAIRLARGFTGRDVIVKFAGNYHGHVDSLLVAAGSSAATLGVPNSPGVTLGTSQRHTGVAVQRRRRRAQCVCASKATGLAAVILEPVVGNMGCVIPHNDFLSELRELTQAHGTLLIFDEVMTGFRVAYGGAQSRFGIAPDLTTLGKIVGGGLPIGAFGGRAEIMNHVLPVGKVFQAGTNSGNPIACAAGIATLRTLRDERAVRPTGASRPAIGRRLEPRGRGGRGATLDRSRRQHADVVLQRRTRDRLGLRQPLGYAAICPVFLGSDRARRVHALQPIRGPVHFGGPHAGRHRLDDRRGASGS